MGLVSKSLTMYRVKQIVKCCPFLPLFKLYSKIVDKAFLHKKLLENWSCVILYFKELRVIYSPFKGLKYPDFISHRSSIYPKLEGVYKYLLNKYFSESYLQKYKTLLDIGCAEGFYAVGVCLINSKITVHAIDINSEALKSCQDMAGFYKVLKRITYFQKLGRMTDG